VKGEGGSNETSPPTISASSSGRCRAAGRVASCAGARLSDAAGALDRRLCPRRHHRHHRAPDRSMAVRAARPAIRHRKPDRGSHQYRHRNRGARARGRLHAAPRHGVERDQRHALRQAKLQFHPRHGTGRGHHPLPPCHAGKSIVPGEDHSRVHRLCEVQSPARSATDRAASARRSMSPANCSK
jgi:hypothetical protein